MKNLHIISSFRIKIFISVMLLISMRSSAQDWNTIVKKSVEDRNLKSSASRNADDYFGHSVSVSGTYAVVGANGEDEDSNTGNTLTNSGAVYVFKNVSGTWTMIKKLTLPVRSAGDAFGTSVSISGEYIVVGATGEDHDETELNSVSNAGSAYIFKRDQGGIDNWGLVKKLVAPVRNTTDNFGHSVSISGDDIVIGVPNEDEDTLDLNNIGSSGSAYIFNRNEGGSNNWGIVRKITASVRATSDNFGYSVSVSGDYIIAGAPNEDHDAAEQNVLGNSGSVYVYYRHQGGTNKWGQVKKLVAGSRGFGDSFGWAVAISGDNLVVGAYLESEDASESNTLTNAGSAYIFNRNQGGANNWGQVKKINAGLRGITDNFGYSVAIFGERVVVGAYQEDEDVIESNTISNAGSAYLFAKDSGGINNWGQIKKINASVRELEDRFSNSIAISGDHVIVGARLEDHDGNEKGTKLSAGSSYIYSIDQGGANNWGLTQKLVMMDRVILDQFGWTLAVDGNYAVAGALTDDEDDSGTNAGTKLDAGSAYVFKNIGGTWTQIKKLVAPDRSEFDAFGYCVSISGDYIAVSAYDEDEDTFGSNTLSSAGSVYLFGKNEGGADHWGFVKKLVPQLRASSDYFGYSVAINGDDIIVGSIGDDEDRNETNFINTTGSAYLFSRNEGGSNNWGQVKKFSAPVRKTDDYYGNAVAISGDHIVVAAYLEDEDANEANPLLSSGSVYLYGRNQGGAGNWGFIKKITASTREIAAYFGVSVALSGDNLIVGAYNEDDDANESNPVSDAGAVYVFNRMTGGADQWGQVKKIVPANRGEGDCFGYSVSISGNQMIVGAPNHDLDASDLNAVADAGAAYIYEHNSGGANNWGLLKKVVPTFRNGDDNMGGSVSVSNGVAFIGAGDDADDESELNPLAFTGSVYFVTRISDPLPIKLLDLKGKRSEDAHGNKTELISLDWSTASEINNNGFEIWASVDGKYFQNIGFVSGKGNSIEIISYRFEAKWITEGYFRLKQIDRNGDYEFSDPVFISGINSKVIIYPNPSKGNFIVTTSQATESAIPVKILNSYGIEMWTGVMFNGKLKVSTSDFPPGVYLLHINVGDEYVVSRVLVE